MAYYKRNEFELSIPINDLKPGMQLVSYQLGSDDLKDGKITKLPRENK